MVVSHRNEPMPKRRERIFIALPIAPILVALVSTAATAQPRQTAGLVGTVRDSSGAVIVGAEVSITSPSLIGGGEMAVSDGSGNYRENSLPPGPYTVAVTASGFQRQTRTAIELLPGATATVDFALLPDGVTETVHVAAVNAAPIDVHASGVSIVIPREILDNLPLSRTVSSYVNLAPGVVKDMAFGGSRSANPLTIDGASGNEPGWGTPSSTPSASWIEELQVVAIGGDAQFGESTGAVANVITRSGSNDLAGVVDYWTTHPAWVANNRDTLSPALQQRFRPLDVLDRWSSTMQAGGPIRRDRMWLIAGADFYRNENRPAGFANVASPPEDAVFRQFEPKFFTKVTAAFGADTRLAASYAHDASNATGANASPKVKPESLTASDWDEPIWNADFIWTIGRASTLELRHGGHDTRQVSGPIDPARRTGPPPHLDTATGILSVNAPSYGDQHRRVTTTTATLGYYVAGQNGGGHDLRFGYEFETALLRDRSGYPGGMSFVDNAGQPSEVHIQDLAIYRPNHHRQTVYASDSWSATSRLTVNGGARFGIYRGAIEGYPTQFAANSISPRLGIAWDVLGDHTLAARIHVGRYHDAMVTSFYDFLDPLSQPTFIDALVVGPNQFEEVYRVDSTTKYSIAPGLRYPYVDELLIGVDRALNHSTSVSALWVRRRFGAIVGFVADQNAWTPGVRRDPGPDGVLGTSDDGGPVTIFLNAGSTPLNPVLDNPDAAYKRYDGLQVIGTRRGSALSAQASYTWSKTRASFDTAFSSNAANNDLSVNGVYVNPNRALNADGRPFGDYTHELKIVATAATTWLGGFRASGVYRYQSGSPWARTVQFAGATQLVAEAVEPRGTRTTPATNVLDLRIEKSFPWGPTRTGVFADVFNVTNQGVAIRYNAVSGPQFGVPLSWSDPRTLRLGCKVSF